MSEPTVRLDIMRYRPGVDERPFSQDYTVPYNDDWVILDALQYIKDSVDGTLSFRWSCHMGVCGSCGMMVNGRPTLTCSAFLRDYYPHPVRVGPLSNFPGDSRPRSRHRRFHDQAPRNQAVHHS
jgi:fumarate reductase iron-sulfur subunit